MQERENYGDGVDPVATSEANAPSDVAQQSTTGRVSESQMRLPRHADRVEYDTDLDSVLRVAAFAGMPRGEEHAINYNTLLIGFALCQDPAARWLQLQPTFRRKELLESRNLSVSNAAEFLNRAVNPGLRQNLYSSSASDMLDHAGAIAESLAGSPASVICSRHLLAAYLFRTPPHHIEDLRRWISDTPDLPVSFAKLIDQKWPAERDAWRTLYSKWGLNFGSEATDKKPDGGAAATFRELYIATFGSDDPSKKPQDLLDVKDEARAFARITASRTTRLPLSIGVFGDWGSGKTFFMDRVREHVEELSAKAKKETDEGKESLYLPDIVQIKFNAWHYVESNLWASLVEYIFSELDRNLRGSQKPREQVERLFEQLSTSRLLKLEAIENLIFMRRERRDAQDRLDTARRDYEGALLRQSVVSSKAFWIAVFKTFKENLKEKDRDQVEKLRKKLGFKDLSESVDALNEVLKEADTEAGRARVLHRAMIAKLGQGTWIFAIVLILFVIPPAVVSVSEMLAALPNFKWLMNVNKVVLALSGMIAAVSGMIGTAVHSTRRALTKLEGFRDSLDAAVKKQTEEFKNKSREAGGFAQAEREIGQLKNELEQAERKFAEADKRSDEVLREYQSATARGRLNAFIRDKITSGDYAKYLGLIATIRKDFEQLAQLMTDVGNDGKSREEYVQAHEEYQNRLNEVLSRAEEGVLSDSEKANFKKDTEVPDEKLFRRIILYIDDLDRCPSDKVVHVLQAIHLLLYFPLFVVVVAVDARWVSRSLREEFPQLLAENIISRGRPSGASSEQSEEDDQNGAAGRRVRDDSRTAATSHDYLEKIFQIPYWVRPMDRDTSKKYVRGIAAGDVVSDPAEAAQERQQEPSIPASGSPPASETRTASGGQAAAPAPQPGSGPAADLEPVPEQKSPPPKRETEQQREYVTRSMTLTKKEWQFLEELAPFVGDTPRRGLRFVNIYRLVKTSLPEELQKQLVSEAGDQIGYRAVITQLAIVTGAPHISGTYFQLLQKAATSIAAARSGRTAQISAEEKKIQTLAELREQLAGELASVDVNQRRALLGALERLCSLNEEQHIDNGADFLLGLELFAPIARRYSFVARQ
jgi:KAP-like P-loop domain-containing protein